MFIKDEFKKSGASLPELVLYGAAVEPGIIELYDGSLQASWRYEPRPLDHETPEDYDHIDEQIAKSLNFGSGWAVETNVIRREVAEYIPAQPDAHPIGRLIDEERELQFTTPGYYFRSDHYITLTYLPPSLKEQAVEGWLLGDGQVANKHRERNLEHFKQRLYTFEGSFRAQLSLTRLMSKDGTDENLSYLWQCVFGTGRKLATPRIPLYLNQRFTGELSAGNEPMLDGKHIRIVCVDAFPAGSWSGVFARLERLPFPYRYSQRQILFHPDVSKKKHKDNEKAWKRAGRSFASKLLTQSGSVDPDAAKMQLDAQAAQGEASRAEFHFGAFNSKVILMHEDLAALAEQIKQVQEAFHLVGYTTRTEDGNAMDSWRGSWPGHCYSDCRVFPVHTKNFAHTMPKSVPYTGSATSSNPLLPTGTPPLFLAVTDGQTPYRGQLHYREAGHTLCVGPTRNGKSTALAFLAAQWLTRYPDPQVFAFDKRGSLRILCEAMGGTYYRFEHPQLCPLESLETADDQSWATWYIEYLCTLNNLKVSAKHRSCITQGIKALAKGSERHRSLTHFSAMLIGGAEDQSIRQALEYYTIDSTSGGSMLDADEDSLRLDETTFAVFEMEYLLTMDSRILHAVMPYLFRLIAKRLHSAKQTFIPIDEAWMTKDPRFAEALGSWLTETAARGGAVFLATQNLSDFISPDNKLRDKVMNQCKNQMFLPNPMASSVVQAPQYGDFGLNPAQILSIAQGKDKREYFLKTPTGFSCIDFQLKNVALAFCGSSSDTHHEQWARLYNRDPHTAPAEWLRMKGESDWASAYEGLLEQHQEVLYAVA